MKLRVGILGATGMVGQRFIERLENHPWFKIESLFASEKSKGKTYCEAAKWHLKSQIPASIRDMEVDAMDTERAEDLDLVFSAIPSEIAKEIEGGFAKKVAVFSNTATYRMYEDIPLVIPEVNDTICIGCGACEYACPATPYKAIFVDGNSVHEVSKKPEVIELKSNTDDFPF